MTTLLDATPKPAWYYVATMRSTLDYTHFEGAVDTDRDDVRVYEFSDSDETVYVAWCPTADGTSVEDYDLVLPDDEAIGSAELIELADEDAAGVSSDLDPAGGSVSVDVSESPVFVRVHRLTCDGDDPNTARVDDQIVCDLDDDGDYMDVDGDGRVGQTDVAEFFSKQHRPAWKQPDKFDFSGNGAVTHGDVVELFDYVALN